MAVMIGRLLVLFEGMIELTNGIFKKLSAYRLNGITKFYIRRTFV